MNKTNTIAGTGGTPEGVEVKYVPHEHYFEIVTVKHPYLAKFEERVICRRCGEVKQ